MSPEVTLLRVTNEGMGKNKKPSGENRKTPRVNVGVPEDWHAVMRRLAAKHRQPVLYLLIDLVKEKAEKESINDLPPAPWEPAEDDDHP